MVPYAELLDVQLLWLDEKSFASSGQYSKRL